MGRGNVSLYLMIQVVWPKMVAKPIYCKKQKQKNFKYLQNQKSEDQETSHGASMTPHYENTPMQSTAIFHG